MLASQTVPLSTPVEVDGQMIASITVRPPTDEDVQAVLRLNAGNLVRGVRLVARLTGLPPKVITKLTEAEPAAIDKIEAYVRPFVSRR